MVLLITTLKDNLQKLAKTCHPFQYFEIIGVNELANEIFERTYN